MNVWLVKPPEYDHAYGMVQVAQAFADAFGTLLSVGTEPPQGRTLVFCGHLLRGYNPDLIIYNTEQVSNDWFATHPDYRKFLQTASEVWDYSKNNIEQLNKHGIKAKLVEVGYMPSMTKNIPDAGKNIDVLHYGSVNERRKKILDELATKCNLVHAFGVYGEKLDNLIARSKIVLNMHYYDTGIHEIFRTSYLMANSKMIVSETSSDADFDNKMWSEGMAVVPYEKLVETCLWLLSTQKEAEIDLPDKLFKYFSSRTQTDILKEAGIL